jgi:hypothetical protein
MRRIKYWLAYLWDWIKVGLVAVGGMWVMLIIIILFITDNPMTICGSLTIYWLIMVRPMERAQFNHYLNRHRWRYEVPNTRDAVINVREELAERDWRNNR